MIKEPNPRDAGGRLVIHEAKGASGLNLLGSNMVLLTGAYCPRGCPLISEDSPMFDGFPGILLTARSSGLEGRLVLSPFQGDSRKMGPDFEEGSLLQLECPICSTPLIPVAPCSCTEASQYMAIYTVKVADPEYMVGLCNCWGCFRSFIKDAGKVVTEYRVTPKSVNQR